MSGLYFKFLQEINKRKTGIQYQTFLSKIHLDGPLLFMILTIISFGLLLLYSSSTNKSLLLWKQLMHIGISITIMVIIAQIPSYYFKNWTIILFYFGITLLLIVLAMGKIGKGAQRWIEIINFRFQPSEIMKFAVPMIVAYKITHQGIPPSLKNTLKLMLYILIPSFLIAKQPDLGTAIMIASSGFCVIFLAGFQLKYIFYLLLSVTLTTPIIWHFLHVYQKERILTLLNPEKDPLGSGYHIIQSKIAIGSGSFLGKGFLHGSQSRLNFLPEKSTDFVFAICGEEFGFIGCLLLIILYLIITLRVLYLSKYINNSYLKLLSNSLGITFFLYVLVNIGMVIGIFPVVGLPLPLISYGGTAMLTIMIGFGLIMSIVTHRSIS